ncbi:hypothetical protein [Ectothiorhodospira variabilis]|uniref:hypothetical protein n=1 Tax=Ectothiorhodospira variabilis TaxID=505694 RepID=UPI001EFB003D|nr:hypothetical protein [Ectothiorhodospira variabilis]MCG5493584.1 hypothetical protein [Ectothiorhodospira variabilis]MCG5496931.1 hypothetical protein [Ectothiorhodospira variabilis]MCG5502913.1 hypothetical protein [Ectothiorhodospira variabilis]MCG5506299.1 hypothetical protein [Ectothiorhodospira variabilis]
MSHADTVSGQEYSTIQREAALRRRMVSLERELKKVEAELDGVRQSRSRQGAGTGAAFPSQPRFDHPLPVAAG